MLQHTKVAHARAQYNFNASFSAASAKIDQCIIDKSANVSMSYMNKTCPNKPQIH